MKLPKENTNNKKSKAGTPPAPPTSPAAGTPPAPPTPLEGNLTFEAKTPPAATPTPEAKSIMDGYSEEDKKLIELIIEVYSQNFIEKFPKRKKEEEEREKKKLTEEEKEEAKGKIETLLLILREEEEEQEKKQKEKEEEREKKKLTKKQKEEEKQKEKEKEEEMKSPLRGLALLFLDYEKVEKKYLPKQEKIEEITGKGGQEGKDLYEYIKNEIYGITIHKLILKIYDQRLERVTERKERINKKLDEMEDKSYGWVAKNSKRLFWIGVAIVFSSILIPLGVWILSSWTFWQLLSTIPVYALIATSTSTPAIYTTLPAIITSLPWQQLNNTSLISGGIGGTVGLSTIITTLIKGAFQEIKSTH